MKGSLQKLSALFVEHSKHFIGGFPHAEIKHNIDQALKDVCFSLAGPENCARGGGRVLIIFFSFSQTAVQTSLEKQLDPRVQLLLKGGSYQYLYGNLYQLVIFQEGGPDHLYTPIPDPPMPKADLYSNSSILTED